MKKSVLFALCLSVLGSFGSAAIAPQTAEAFCGFYVGGAGASLFNNATQVVLMREGTRTVLSMQNNYQGPLEDFAMVIPVPVVLQEENVKTLPGDLFAKIDQLSAPRLVEYWEMDPCMEEAQEMFDSATGAPNAAGGGGGGGGGGVVVEAEFKVGEYQISILSANESSGLDAWLRDNDYNIPDGAEPVLRPYVENGMYFFVARIISQEVTFDSEGRAVLSPLRFHYDADAFSLPIRLGLLSAEDEQDLLIYTLARNQRYEVANASNVTIPTNIDVRDAVRNDFGAFYNELFSRTLARNPGAVVTEYSWDASTCDPCPGPTLDANDFATLGADVAIPEDSDPWSNRWVLTRLHARYSSETVGEDLVFRAADPIAGGREWRDEDDNLEEGAVASDFNNFQGRYAIRHRWTGAITCTNPVFGRWGGPPGREWDRDPNPSTAQSPNSTGDDFRTTSTAALEVLVAEDVPEIGVKAQQQANSGDSSSGCALSPQETGSVPLLAFVLGVFGFLIRRRTS